MHATLFAYDHVLLQADNNDVPAPLAKCVAEAMCKYPFSKSDKDKSQSVAKVHADVMHSCWKVST